MTQNERTELKKAGNFFRMHRKENDYSIEELAERCNLSDRCISDIERGECMPKASTLLTICRELKINTGELFNLYPRIEEE